MRGIIISFINLYRIFISPILRLLFGVGCRFTPTCSTYAKEAIGTYGVSYGIMITLKRLLKCHPFSVGYFDPLPRK